MTHIVVAEFKTAEAMLKAADSAAGQGHPPDDALTPFPLPDVMPHLKERRKRPVGWVMTAAAAAAAGAAWFMQWYSAAVDYPIISGSRPLNSWPIFFLVAYEACILFGGIAGFIAFARDCRLPSLHHPFFNITALERASQDRFFLIFETSETRRGEIAGLVTTLNPLTISEVAL
jgi:Protein of unknown function (DUF3341)